MKLKNLVLIFLGVALGTSLLVSLVAYAEESYFWKINPIKCYFAKEVKENGICHVVIDEHFSIYFEDEPLLDHELSCHLYFDGKKTGIYSFNHIFKDKYNMARWLINRYYKEPEIIKEPEYYKPCK